MEVLSFITSFMLPVTRSPPPPRGFPSASALLTIPWVSMYRAAPPMDVHASPMATPWGVSPGNMRSLVKGGFPTYSSRVSASTVHPGALRRVRSVRGADSAAATTWRASLRQIFRMCFSRLRTPASRQYQRTRDSREERSMARSAGTAEGVRYSGKGGMASGSASGSGSASASASEGASVSPSAASVFFSSNRPLSSMDLGTRYLSAISNFSGTSYPERLIISIRSRSGPGMVSSTLAVHMKSTLLISTGTSR
mmetsp:Transcript_31669/g.72631  ORF Transcript_31669/g.72631 Transcript_31669/m.72631 type:complete len:253 (-) Transcript_31669:2304-3062(-)